MDMTRSQFLRLLAGTSAGALGLATLGACSKEGSKDPIDGPPGSPDAPKPDAAVDAPIDAPGPMGNCMQNGTNTTIATNHGHAMTVSMADVTAGVEKIYNIQGTSSHPHTVTVTAAMFAMLQQNIQVTVVSSEDAGHPHTVTIRCA
ncbi:MAG TPA: hypothetical protein VNO30_10590 [Kofleriaceae bacterium]|nr:hypothetical protein [Kofleriaceae bacterium]